MILAELVEFTVPLIYVLSICTGYFGPNAGIYGNIGNDYWQFSKIEDIDQTVKNIMLFVVIDASSVFVCSAILWKVCRINLYRVFCILQKEFGNLIAMNLAMLMTAASTTFAAYNYFLTHNDYLISTALLTYNYLYLSFSILVVWLKLRKCSNGPNDAIQLDTWKLQCIKTKSNF